MLSDLEKDERERYFCGSCKYFNIKSDRDDVVSPCKRIDHKHLQFSRPYFKSYDCNQFNGVICSDFEPADWCIYAKEHWGGFDAYWKSYKKYWNPNAETDSISFFIDKNTDVRYKVKLTDFVFGTMYNENGTLKAFEKTYYKRSKLSPIGYELIHERI